MNPQNNNVNSTQENQISNISYDNTGYGPQMLDGKNRYNTPNNLNLNQNNDQFNLNLGNNLNNNPGKNNYFQELKNSQSNGQQIPINFQLQNKNPNLFNKDNNKNNEDHEMDHFTDLEKNNIPENNEHKNSEINKENQKDDLGGFSIFEKDNQKYYPFSQNLNQQQEELNKINQNNNNLSQQFNNNLGNNMNINSIQENKNTFNMNNQNVESQNVMSNKNKDPTTVNIIKNDFNNIDMGGDGQEEIDDNAMSMPKEDLEKIQNPINIINNNNEIKSYHQIKDEINNQNQNVLSQNNIQNINDNMANFNNNNVNSQNNFALNPFNNDNNNNNLIGNENMNFNNMNNEINNKGNEIKSNAVLNNINNMNYNQKNENLINKKNNNDINNKNDNQGLNFVNKDLINQMQMQMSNENINNKIGNMNINNNNNFGLNNNQNNNQNNQISNNSNINMDNINNQIENMNINNNNNLGLNNNLQNSNENNNNIPHSIEQNENNILPSPPPSFKCPAMTGLKNLGDTSYLNAVLQLLGSVRGLAKYLVNQNNQKYFVDNINNAPLSFVIYRLFTHLFPLQVKPNREIYSPETLLKVLANYNQVYNSNEARNPNDLLLFILNKIHKEINLKKMVYIIKMNHLNKEDVINKSLTSFIKSNESIISKNFHWFELKTQTCSNCQKSFYYMNNYETLELDISNINVNSLNNSPLTIGKCLQLQREKMMKSFCESCKTYFPMKIITEVYSTPSYFIFSLNREGNPAQNLLNIPFSIEENINLQPFIVEKQCFSKFKLQGIVSISSKQNNKYVCFGKSPINDKWYLYNDDKVDISDINNILNLHNQNFDYIPCILLYKYSA